MVQNTDAMQAVSSIIMSQGSAPMRSKYGNFNDIL